MALNDVTSQQHSHRPNRRNSINYVSVSGFALEVTSCMYNTCMHAVHNIHTYTYIYLNMYECMSMYNNIDVKALLAQMSVSRPENRNKYINSLFLQKKNSCLHFCLFIYPYLIIRNIALRVSQLCF